MVTIMPSDSGHAISLSSNKSLPLFNNGPKSPPRVTEIRGLSRLYIARIIIQKRRMCSLGFLKVSFFFFSFAEPVFEVIDFYSTLEKGEIKKKEADGPLI